MEDLLELPARLVFDHLPMGKLDPIPLLSTL